MNQFSKIQSVNQKIELSLLEETNWTGNVCELRNIIERLIILCLNKVDGKDVLRLTNPTI